MNNDASYGFSSNQAPVYIRIRRIHLVPLRAHWTPVLPQDYRRMSTEPLTLPTTTTA